MKMINLPVKSLWFMTIVVLCLVSGCQKHEKQQTPPPPPLPVLPKNEVLLPPNSSKRMAIVEQSVNLVSAPVMEPVTGKLAYDETQTARITAPIAGRVISPLPALGISVKAKDMLLELDSPELGQAKEDYANALADLRLAETAMERASLLYNNRVLPLRDLQQAENAMSHARDGVSRSLMHLKNLGVPDHEINNRYLVRSPISGTLTERHVNPGMEVRPDLPEPLFVVSNLHSLWLLMSIFEKDLGLIHLGTRVRVRVPAYPDRQFPATVEYIDKLVDESTRTVKVRCKIANEDGKLLPAMFATAEIQSESRDKAIVIPLTALFTEGEGDQVFIRIGDGHYRQREVKVRLRLRDRAVIAQGLKPGETIVSEGALLLRTEEANEQTAAPGPGAK